MRPLAQLASLAALALLAGCQPSGTSKDPVLVRQQFAGLRAVASRPDLAVTGGLLGSPESLRLRGQVAQGLAEVMPSWFGASGAAATNHAAALVPVVQTLLDGESVLVVRGDGKSVRSCVLAARVEGAAPTVGQELGRVLASVLGGGAPAAGAVSWEMPGAAGGAAAKFFSTNGWVVIGRGPGAFEALGDPLRQGRLPAPALSNFVWRGEADLASVAKLAGWKDAPPGPVAQWPRVQATVEPRNGRLRTQASLEYGSPLALALQAWVIPTSVLTDPLVGFTAMQGADVWLGRTGWMSDLGVKEWPKQMFLWSLGSRPWQQYFAGPVASPTNVIAQLAPTLPLKLLTNTVWAGQSFGMRLTNQGSRLELRGLPFFAPFLEGIRQDSTEMLFGGLFLPAKGAPPAPSELLGQVAGRTNLVMYDWEVTGRVIVSTNEVRANPSAAPRRKVETNQIGRLLQFKHLAQFGTMMSAPVTALPTTAAGDVAVPGSEWIDASLPVLGDTVTEVTLAGPSTLALTRQSQAGFNSIELIYLLRWLENPGFPGWTPPVPPEPRRRPNAPATPAGAAPAAPAKPTVQAPKP